MNSDCLVNHRDRRRQGYRQRQQTSTLAAPPSSGTCNGRTRAARPADDGSTEARQHDSCCRPRQPWRQGERGRRQETAIAGPATARDDEGSSAAAAAAAAGNALRSQQQQQQQLDRCISWRRCRQSSPRFVPHFLCVLRSSCLRPLSLVPSSRSGLQRHGIRQHFTLLSSVCQTVAAQAAACDCCCVVMKTTSRLYKKYRFTLLTALLLISLLLVGQASHPFPSPVDN